MVRILCPFCDQEIELDNDLSGEYLCEMCDETLLYENKDLLEKPIVLGKHSNFLTVQNIVSWLVVILLSIPTFGIIALIVALGFVIAEVADRREIQRRAISDMHEWDPFQ